MGAASWLRADRLSREQIDRWQSRLLPVTVQLASRVSFYMARLRAAGLEPSRVDSLERLRQLPPTAKADLRDAYPFGLFGLGLERVVRLHASSGTRGKPTLVGYSAADLQRWQMLVARCLAMVGVGASDVVHVAYGYGLFTGGLGLHGGAELLGCAVVPASGGNTERQCLLLRDLKASVLCCTPSYALAIAEALGDGGAAGLQLRLGVFGAEP